MINYSGGALYYSNDDKIRKNFEKRLSKKFHVLLMEEAKWYLGMGIVQKNNYISLDQNQYIENITVRFEKVFRYHFKGRQSPLPTNFTPSKEDSPATEELKKLRFENLNYRSVIRALLFVLCCTQSDITYTLNKLAKFSHNPGTVHMKALLHLFVFLKNTSYQGLKIFSDFRQSDVCKLLNKKNKNSRRFSLYPY